MIKILIMTFFKWQVELRVMPDDKGIRRVRVYGPDYYKVNIAQEELQLMYQQISIDQVRRRQSSEWSIGKEDIGTVAKISWFREQESFWKPKCRFRSKRFLNAQVLILCGEICPHSSILLLRFVRLDSTQNVVIYWGTKRCIDKFRFLLEELFNNYILTNSTLPLATGFPSFVGSVLLFILDVLPQDTQPSSSGSPVVDGRHRNRHIYDYDSNIASGRPVLDFSFPSNDCGWILDRPNQNNDESESR